MSDYDKIEITTRRVIYRLKSPATLGEVGKAIQAARVECAKVKGVEVSKLFDDAVMVMSYDQDIHIYFEYEVRE